MKLSTISFVAVLGFYSQLTVAAPADSLAKRLADATTGMTWTGPILPGDGPDAHVLFGTAIDIYGQIIAINPSYKATDFANPTTPKRALQSRNKSGLFCNVYSNGDNYNLETQASFLHNIGGSCSVGGGPRACIRMACENTSGIFLCNDNTYSIAPDCGYLASYADDIISQCGGNSPFDDQYSGQEFDSDNYNVVIGYANCNHSPHENPF